MDNGKDLTVIFGNNKVIARNISNFPTDTEGFTKKFFTTFDIDENSVTEHDKNIIKNAITKILEGKNNISIKLEMTFEENKTFTTFRNLSEFFNHYLESKIRSFWINYSTWKDFLSKIKELFIIENPPCNLKKVVILDENLSITYDLENIENVPVKDSKKTLSKFDEMITNVENTLFILEDADLILEADNNYGGEIFKTELKNILDSDILESKNCYIIVAVGASDDILIPRQLKGYWVSYKDSSKDFPMLEKLGNNLTALAKAGEIDEIQGRENEINELIIKLTRGNYNNALLVGKPGIGKTAIVKGLGLAISKNEHPISKKELPAEIQNIQIFDIPYQNLLKDTRLQGSLESRLSALVNEVRVHKNEVIVFLDEFHQVFSNELIRNALKPPLANGEFPCIAATTEGEFQQYVSGVDTAFEQRFAKINVGELSKEIIKNIFCNQIKGKNKDIKFEDNVLEYIYRINKALDPTNALPRNGEKILGTILEKIPKNSEITNETIKQQFKLGNISLRLNKSIEFNSILSSLSEKIKGQNSQIEAILNSIRSHFFLLTKIEKPLVMMFMGTTGTGKTELAIQLSKSLWQDDDRYLIINMGAIDNKTSIVGAPPGYIGYENSSPILNFIRTKDSGIIILDEFEKILTNKDVLHAFLEIFDKGTTIDNRGIQLNCRPFIFILTSNLGGELNGKSKNSEIIKLLENQKLPKEFIGRIALFEVFNHIAKDQARKLISNYLKEYNQLPDLQCEFTIDENAINNILNDSDFDNFGVRNLKRIFSEHINRILSENNDRIKKGEKFVISYSENHYSINRDSKKKIAINPTANNRDI